MSGEIPNLRGMAFSGVILGGLDDVPPYKIGSSGKEFPPLSAVLSSNLACVAMDDASKDSANVQASAAALQVILSIYDTKNHNWSGARFVLRGDKRDLDLAEVFIAAITGAFTALVNGHKFPTIRTSLSNKNPVITAAEDAALVKIELIRVRKSEQRAIQRAEEASRRRDRDDDDYSSGNHRSNMNQDGANSRNCEPSDENMDDDDDHANYTLVPNPPIQKGNYTFYPPIPERNQTAASIATRNEDAAEEASQRLTDEEIAAQFVYQPSDPTVQDKRHPTVIEHEKKTGIKNVVGTGLHGRLTRKDILEAATNMDNLPDDIKPLFMSRDQLIDYEKEKAAAAKAAAKAAKEATAAAEANQREKLKIAGAASINDSEQESPAQGPLSKTMAKLLSEATRSKPSAFDPHRVIASSETPTPATHNPLRKSRNRVVVPDSDSEDTPPPQVDFGVFSDSLKNRRAQREASGSSVRVTRNGSPVVNVAPHEFRIGERKRFTSPALSIDEIEKKLFSPVMPKKYNKLDARHPLREEREESGGTEELTQRSPAPTFAPKPNVMSKSSRQSSLKAAGKMKVQSNSSIGSFGGSIVAPSDEASNQMALALNLELNSKKRRRDSGVSQSESQHFSQPTPPKRGQPSKLRHHADAVGSASPAPSVVSTAASERPMRTKKAVQPRQSLPAQTTLKSITSANNLAIARAVKKAKAESKTKVKNEDTDSISTRTSSASMAASAAAKRKLTNEEKVKLPIAVTNEEYDVEAIVGHRVHDNGLTYYHVKWVGYPDEDNTWEPANNLNDAHKILNEYRSSLHKNQQVEDVLSHRSGYKYLTGAPGQRKQKYVLEYLVKWKGSAREYNSWEWEETIKGRSGIQPLLYYRIRKRVGFGGNGHWSEAKNVAAIKLLKEAGLQPEAGGRISAADFAEAIKDEDDDRDELALSAREESVYASAQEDCGMNQTI